MCLSPVTLYKNDPDKSMTFPCGKCEACLKRSQTMWFTRLLCEIPYHKSCHFLTLTYDGENIREKGLLHTDVQLFIKRLRKNEKQTNMKYYVCGEYGSETQRPHYHMILYHSIDKDVKEVMDREWRLGIVHVGLVTPKSIRYCLSYMKKMLQSQVAKELNPPYQKMSKGLGKKYYEGNMNRLYRLGYITINGCKYAIPRYYLKLDKELESLQDERCETYKRSAGVPSLKDVDYRIRNESKKIAQIKANITANKNGKKRKL
ncbi:replication initiation protein [Tortoise microvirus 27]|nr:replication initiation protein [Tortoise microvirus 27]